MSIDTAHLNPTLCGRIWSGSFSDRRNAFAQSETVDELTQRYFAKMSIPERARIDAFHMATAVAYEMDYLLSWNCRHIASAHVQKTIQKMNNGLEIETPILCTPETLMEV